MSNTLLGIVFGWIKRGWQRDAVVAVQDLGYNPRTMNGEEQQTEILSEASLERPTILGYRPPEPPIPFWMRFPALGLELAFAHLMLLLVSLRVLLWLDSTAIAMSTVLFLLAPVLALEFTLIPDANRGILLDVFLPVGLSSLLYGFSIALWLKRRRMRRA